MSPKFVFGFGVGRAEGHGGMRDLLGGKGANLAEMTRLGVPVPPGFTISTEACREFLRSGDELPAGLEAEVRDHLRRLEEVRGQGFGDPGAPLLVSVRSGAAASMPGMMDTILNLGLNRETVEGLARRTGDRRFALDCHRRFLQMFGDVVLGVAGEEYESILAEKLRERGAAQDRELTESDLEAVTAEFSTLTEQITRRDLPSDPRHQLRDAIGAVFRSWNNRRAVEYRRLHGIPDDGGTAVTVQAMVFGNRGPGSGTGVAFTRNPATGDRALFGEYLRNAQGEDVVAGSRTPCPLARDPRRPGESLQEQMPETFRELRGIAERLEGHFRDMLDLEFTVEEGRLFLLQARRGERTGLAALQIAHDLAREGVLEPREAILRVEPEQLLQVLSPVFPEGERSRAVREGRRLARGLPAGPGAASGRLALSAEAAVRFQGRGEAAILARPETSPEDIVGMQAAAGILTSRGGVTSHAAVVARGMGKTCVVGCGDLRVDPGGARVTLGERCLQEGDALSLDGTSGEVFLGYLPTIPSEVFQSLMREQDPEGGEGVYPAFVRFLGWADATRRLRVRANADTPADAHTARRLGAEGIGLARTEHMFFAPDRILAVREMILAGNLLERQRALAKLQPMQRRDFHGIFREMDGLPVTIRLLDPPLHEFLPPEGPAQEALARALGADPAGLAAKVEALREVNPMLGHRGCRLGLTYPEIYQTQVQAIFEAACDRREEGGDPRPEVMVPLVGLVREMAVLRGLIAEEAERVMGRRGIRVPYLVGTMMEVPRACLDAGAVAGEAEFFSFGTNDLTQMAFGFSRDDAAPFLKFYLERGILSTDPFVGLDVDGVGRLVEMAVRSGRESRPGLHIGICGEHGGDPASIEWFHAAGLDYGSCSPYRIPIARLAAARAAAESAGGGVP
ncbi:MAG: pyruvate, phosphate dikinase [Acidobacteria bacterium]|nr:pyruvate, phosphate dikinase [Acidobacteriota bacterium]